MSYDFRDRVVLVTGASSGIGAATAEAFARAGAAVALTGRNIEELEKIAASLRASGGKVNFSHLDVTNRAEVFDVIYKVAGQLGKIDILVNNAGIGQCLPIEEVSEADTQRIIDTNVMGVIHCTQAVVPIMRKQGGGQIVNVASTVGHKGVPFLSMYCATKFAVRGLTESLRLELQRDRIEVIGVSPGTTDTNFFKRATTNDKGWWLKAPHKSSAASVARSILSACARHKREVVLTPEGRAMVFLNKLAPRFVDFMTLKVATR